MRVLLVEDDPAVRETLSDVLVEAGHTVGAVGTFAEAVAALERDPWDVLLADLVLPGGSGLDLAARARARGVGVVLCSGHPAHIAQLHGHNIIHLTKPFSTTALEVALDAAAPAGAGEPR